MSAQYPEDGSAEMRGAMLDRVFAKGPIHPPTYDQAAAMRRASAGYGPAEPSAQMFDDMHGRRREAAADWPEPLNLQALAQRAPQRPQFIMPDWLPAGYATLLAGHGGVGKSAIALHLAVCNALGIPFFGLPCERRRVLYLSCEDRERVLHWRLAHICGYLGANMAELAGSLDILDLVGHDVVLWKVDPRTGYTITVAFAQLAERMERDRIQVLIVDGVSDTFGGNENARSDVKRFVNALLSLVPPNDGALVLLGHVPKPTAASAATSEGYSGSTQWHNAVRARWYLYPESTSTDGERERTGRLLLELQKSNHGRMDQSVTFAWDAEAHMFVATSTFGTSVVDRKHRDDSEQLAILRAFAGCAQTPPIVVPAAMQGQRTAYHVLSKRPEFPDGLRASTAANRRRFWSHVETLRQSHWIEEREYRRSNRHPGAEFVLTAEGVRQCAK